MKNKFEFLKDILNKSNNETVIINRGEFLDSSVLIIITKINDEYNVIFEKRAKGIRQSGEICFPGGIKSKEDQNYLDTALRECEEEIGINRKNIDILGGLGTFIMGGKVIIDVFIGFCDMVFRSMPCPFLGDDNYCAIYESRPKACREYPHTDRKKFFQIYKLSVKNASTCPIVYEVMEGIQEL